MNAIARTARFVDVARADFGRVYSYTASLSGEPRLAHTRALLSRIVVRRLFFLLDAMSKRVRAGRGRASGVADDRIGEPPRERA
jgi:hypothetical protein